MKNIVYFLVAALVISWVLGFVVFKVMGALVHLLLLLAVVLLIYNWLSNKTST
ncbi:MAG: lmo0937 family membrane protein [Maribacter sp.]|uniref:lmo0937 family membrane protein n=1 Tax=Maribacter sp. IgM3_T14_3 TaxID=3415140 RepID=UPI00278FF8DE|nr:lmo0937 family membrane protein [Maribacter sp.]